MIHNGVAFVPRTRVLHWRRWGVLLVPGVQVPFGDAQFGTNFPSGFIATQPHGDRIAFERRAKLSARFNRLNV
jgi:hypothetical protein